MPLRRVKKIPRKPTKDTPPNELFVAKSGSDARFGINLDGVIHEISTVPTTSAPGSGGSGGTTDHGSLSGLSDDDHAQYVLRSIVTAKGDLFARDGSAVNRLAVGTDGQLIIPDQPSTVGMKWGNLVFNDDELVSNDDEIVTV
jgi:hypothetical protein